jgi:hypothetical protein
MPSGGYGFASKIKGFCTLRSSLDAAEFACLGMNCLPFAPPGTRRSSKKAGESAAKSLVRPLLCLRRRPWHVRGRQNNWV